jgi:hypothetical protein
MLRDFPNRQHDNQRVYNIQEATTINDVARNMPQIYVALDNRQANHQASVVEMEGMISNHLVSILIDPGSNLSYVSPQTIEKCKFMQVKHVKSWLVQLATETKKKSDKGHTNMPIHCEWIVHPSNPKHASFRIL